MVAGRTLRPDSPPSVLSPFPRGHGRLRNLALSDFSDVEIVAAGWFDSPDLPRGEDSKWYDSTLPKELSRHASTL